MDKEALLQLSDLPQIRSFRCLLLYHVIEVSRGLIIFSGLSFLLIFKMAKEVLGMGMRRSNVLDVNFKY